MRHLVIRALTFLLIWGWLSLRRDGYFPFGADVAPVTLGLWQAVQVIIFAGLIYIFWKPTFISQYVVMKTLSLIPSPPPTPHLKPTFLVATILSLSIFYTLFLHYQTGRAFADYFNLPTIVLLVTGSGALLWLWGWMLWGTRFSAAFAVLGVNVILMLLPIAHFPITANTADLLPIIDRQLEASSAGQNIYQYYLLDNGVTTQAVRQPGTTFSFWPAYAAEADLRWMSIIFTTLTGVILFLWLNKQTESNTTSYWVGFLVISLWLLLPYRHARHDLYEPCYWLLLTLALYLLQLRKLAHFSIIWGLSIFTQVWSWLFSPLVFIYLGKNYGWRKAVAYCALAGLIGGGLLALFILPDYRAYLEHVFGFYAGEISRQNYAETTMYLTPLIQLGNISNLLLPVQIICTLAVVAYATIRIKQFQSLIFSLIAVFFIFVQFNSISWNYMYINLLLLLAIIIINDTVLPEGKHTPHH